MSSLLLTLFVGLFILVGIVLGNYFKKNKKFVDVSIGIAVGVMSLLLIKEIVPHSYELLESSTKQTSIIILIIGAIVGFLILKLLDMFVPHHEHESSHQHKHKNDDCHNEHLEHVGILASVAIVIHNIIEGMTLYVTSLQDFHSGLLLCLAIGLHNIPLGIIISSTIQNKKDMVINSIVLSISTFIGGLIMFSISQVITNVLVGILLSVTFGMLIYILFMELLPQIIHSKEKRYHIIGIIIGVLLLIISSHNHHH